MFSWLSETPNDLPPVTTLSLSQLFLPWKAERETMEKAAGAAESKKGGKGGA